MKTVDKPNNLSSWDVALGSIYFGLLLTLILFQVTQGRTIQKQIEKRSDSSMTLVFQFDREVLRLRHAIELFLVSPESVEPEGIIFRLDIVNSRLDLLNNSPAAEEVIESADHRKLLDRFSTIANEIQNIMGAAKVDMAALQVAHNELVEIQPAIQSLSFETNRRILITVERQYQYALQQIAWVIFLLVLQMLVVLIGFVMLKKGQNQLRQMKLALESRVWDRTAAQAEAEAASRAKSHFIAVASHDLRQPMAALALYTGMLGLAVKPGHGSLVSNMQNCMGSISELLNDLMDIGRLGSGAVATNLSSFSIEDLCTSMLASYGASATKKGLYLRCRHSPTIVLRTDRQLFKRALGNLIDNSLKYTQHGGVLVATRHRYGRMWVEIWDTGIGIPDKDVLHIFDEFKQLSSAALSQGCGLGLTITAKIAAVLNLEMRVQSRQGYGSMFALELPISKCVLPELKPPQLGRSIFTIGLVENNIQILGALEAALQSLGHTVFCATEVSELIGDLDQITPDIIISDYRLETGGNGLDVIETLRARYGQKMAAIVLTGDTSPNLVADLAIHRIAVYTKPISLADLQSQIELACLGKDQPGKAVAMNMAE